MLDAALHLEAYFPAAGANASMGPLDLGVDVPGFSDNWRQGKLRVTVPALPNNTDSTKTINITLQDSNNNGQTFADTAPQIRVNIVGVASTGSAATTVDCPLPPGLRGPLQVIVAVPAGAGDNTAALVTADWVAE